MRTRLISIPTDTFPLDGVMYEPDSKVVGSALYFHGNTMNFYTGAARFLPEAMCALGLVFVAFNRRGHDILSTRASRQAVGGAYQTVAESIADNAFAAAWMKEQGYANPIILGHSYGGMLSTQHVVDHPATPALILLSAGRGGIAQDTTGGTEKLFAMDRLEELTMQAKELVAKGRGEDLIMMPGWWYITSATSFLDRLAHVPDTIALAPKITCPVLAIRGDLEDVHRYPAEEFQAACGQHCHVEIIPHCDHFYNQREDAVIQVVGDWLKKHI